jgi:hypothetical protein
MRKKCRSVIVVPSHLSDLSPHLRRKNFRPLILPADPLDKQHKERWLSARTLVTDKPEELEYDNVPVLEFSLIDITQVKADGAALADMISHGWMMFRLKTEGWFILKVNSSRSDSWSKYPFGQAGSSPSL